MADGGFIFIEESGLGPHESTTKSRIKMHVMDRVVSRKRALKQKTKQGEDEENMDQLSSQSYSRNAQDREIHPAVAQNMQASHGKLVPFSGIQEMLRMAGTPIHVTPVTKFLLHHFLNHRSRALCTITVETGWLKFAVRNPALFNSTLWHWLCYNKQFIPEVHREREAVLAVKGYAIREINAALNKSSHGEISDEAIASVACFANSDLAHGDLEEAKIHFRGLKAMIGSRKGIQNLGYQGLISRIVQWTDTCHAILMGSELKFEAQDERIEPSLWSEPVAVRISRLKMIAEIREVTDELSETPRDQLPNDRRVSLGRWLLKSNRELLAQIRAPQKQGLSTVVAAAMLIYMFVVLRGMGRSSRVVRYLVQDLKNSIINVLRSEGDAFAEDPPSLCWVLLVGILAAGNENVEKMWFLECLRKVCELEDVIRWENLRRLLEPNQMTPQPFRWILDHRVLELSSVNTKALLD